MRAVGRPAIVAGLLCVLCPSFAFAQAARPTPPSAADQAQALSRAVVEVVALPTLADLTTSRSGSGPGATASIVATAGGGRGEFKFGAATTDGYTLFSAGLSAPLVADTARFVLGDQLPAGNKLLLEGTRVLYSRVTVDDSDSARAKISALLEPIGRLTAEASPAQAQAAPALVRSLARDRLIKVTRLVLLTGKFEYGRSTFAFRSRDDDSKQEELHEPFSYALQGGYLWLREGGLVGTYVGGGYRRSESWKAPDATTRCPVGDEVTGPVTCESVVIGPPARTRRESLSLEMRQRNERFGWMPQLTYDAAASARDKRWGFEAPLYLAARTDPGTELTGGIVLGASQASGRYVAVFIGPSFSLPWSEPKATKVLGGLSAVARR